ncbi:MAG TPA: hypothetical protein PKD72_10835 [Gemmatales bacterium]|nr:hypothetical protein [Gemmatales bacterium]
MAHQEPINIANENRRLGELGLALSGVSYLVGLVALVAAVVLGYFSGPYGDTTANGGLGTGLVRLQYAYLHGFMYFLTITLGGLFFTMALYITGARWGIVIRRVPELVARNAPLMAILSLPILIPLISGSHALYEWADKEAVAKEHLLQHKKPWLNVPLFTIRMVIYFAIWSLLGFVYYWRSVKCDETGDPNQYRKAKWLSPIGMILFALTTTFASFDLLMSLTPTWYSTIFGVYIFAGCNIGIFAFTILAYRYVQHHGVLTHAVTTEHYHDLGKLLFAFVFFWGYIAASQYLLIWYANLPEETAFYKPRESSAGWWFVSLLLLFTHLLIPFPGLLSRWIKRSKPALIFWACWMLVAHWIDLFYIIHPTWAGRVSGDLLKPIDPQIPLLEILCTVGVGGIWLGTLAKRASTVSLVPEKDPYLPTSLAFQNF